MYGKALRGDWFVAMAVAILSLVLVPVERLIGLRKEHNTEFGIRGEKDKKENIVGLDA